MIKPFSKKYFYLIKTLSISSFKTKDQRAFLGFLWSFLNPLFITTILFFLFKSRMSIGADYVYFPYILIGMVTWNFFVISTNSALASLSSQSGLVKSVAFPREVLTLSSMGTMIIQHVFELLAIFYVLFVCGIGVTKYALFLPFIILFEILIVSGVSLLLACLCVYVWDLRHIWSVLTTALFFVCPVFYDIPQISPGFRWTIMLNPVSQIMIFVRDVLLYQRMPSIVNVCVVCISSVVIFVFGYAFFRYHEFKIVERV